MLKKSNGIPLMVINRKSGILEAGLILKTLIKLRVIYPEVSS